MVASMRGLAVAAVLVVALPAAVGAAVPVAMYPPRGPGVSADLLADVRAMLESVVRGAARRGVLSAASPLSIPASCPEPVQDACVARLAPGGAGLVLVSTVRGDSLLSVTLALVDAAGKRTKGVVFGVDAFIMDARPAQQALATLELLVNERDGGRGLVSAPPPAPATATPAPTATATPATPTPTATPTATPTPRPSPSSEPDLRVPPPAVPPRSVAVRAPARVKETWHLPAAKWTAIGGLGLLALGAGVGYLDRRLADDLATSHRDNRLTGADRARYDRVETYNLAANVLFASGGAALATAGVFWAMAPDPGSSRRVPARLGVQGRF